jgi:hypothetical protein
MIRARLAVDRAIEEGLINSGRPLLVIGAGAAGATAAIRSALRGVSTVLIDAAPAPFLRQAACLIRWVDPVQYDWPLHHWSAGSYPWTPPPMPLPWAANYSNLAALGWTAALNRARWRHPRFFVFYRTRLVGRPVLVPAHSTLRVVLGPHRFLPFSVPYVGMILSCVGAGTEKSTAGKYSGFDFWSSDSFQSLARTRHDHSALERLHQTHQDVVDRLLPSPPAVTRLATALAKAVSNAPDTVTLMYPCTHFSRCYGLNRFLVLLIAAYLRRYRGVPTLLPGRSLDSVSGLSHTCANNASACHCQDHHVTPNVDPDCRIPRSVKRATASSLGTSYNVVIVRHGIDAPPPLFSGARPVVQPRQMLPYHLSH